MWSQAACGPATHCPCGFGSIHVWQLAAQSGVARGRIGRGPSAGPVAGARRETPRLRRPRHCGTPEPYEQFTRGVNIAGLRADDELPLRARRVESSRAHRSYSVPFRQKRSVRSGRNPPAVAIRQCFSWLMMYLLSRDPFSPCQGGAGRANRIARVDRPCPSYRRCRKAITAWL